MKLMSKMGYKYVNDYKVGTKYHCKAVRTYWQCGEIVVRKISYLLLSLYSNFNFPRSRGFDYPPKPMSSSCTTQFEFGYGPFI